MSTFPTIDLDSGVDLETAYEMVLETFVESGFRVLAGRVMSSISDSSVDGIAKVFNFHRDDKMYTGLVYPDEWSDEVTRAVLSVASNQRLNMDRDGLVVISAHEPPEVITAVTARKPIGFTVVAELESAN